MPITTSEEKIYLCKENDDLKLTMEGFTLPDSNTWDASKSELVFEPSFIYSSGTTNKYTNIRTIIPFTDVSVSGTTLIAYLRWTDLNDMNGDQFEEGLVDRTGGGEHDFYHDAETVGNLDKDSWKNAERIYEESPGGFNGDSALYIDLKNSNGNIIQADSWTIWDTSTSQWIPDILNGSSGSSISEDSNFLYTNISNCSSSAGAIGDPHITTFQGDKYTL